MVYRFGFGNRLYFSLANILNLCLLIFYILVIILLNSEILMFA